MQYKPRWLSVIAASIFVHFVVLSVVALMWSVKPQEVAQSPEDKDIELVDVDFSDKLPAIDEPEVPEVVETAPPAFEFPPIILPPLPEPVYVEPLPPPEPLPEITKPPEVKSEEVEQKVSSGESEEKTPEDDSKQKVKVISKAFPKDVYNEWAEKNSGIFGVGMKPVLRIGKVVYNVTVGKDGKVKSAEIARSGGKDLNGLMIDDLSMYAARLWVFEPFIDEDGNPQEVKTHIEFSPEDF